MLIREIYTDCSGFVQAIPDSFLFPWDFCSTHPIYPRTQNKCSMHM